MARPVEVSGGAAASFAVALALASPAAAGWSTQPIGATPEFSPAGVNVVGNARGDAVAAWRGRNGIRVAFAAPGKPFGRPYRVHGSARATSVGLDMNEHGEALIVYGYSVPNPAPDGHGCCSNARAVVASRDAVFGKVRRLGGPAVRVKVRGFDIDGDGRIAVVWRERGGDPAERLVARLSDRQGRLGQAAQVAKRSEAACVAIVDGVARVYYARPGRLYQRSVGQRHARGGSQLVGEAASLTDPVMAADASGDAVVGWRVYHGGDSSDVHVGTRAAEGPFRFSRVFAGDRAYELRAAIARSGVAAIAWATLSGVFATSGGPGGAFPEASPVWLRSPTAIVQDLELGIRSDATSAIGWTYQQHLNGDYTRHVRAALRTPSGTVFDEHALLDTAGTDQVNMTGQGSAAVDDGGRARVVWQQRREVHAARRRP